MSEPLILSDASIRIAGALLVAIFTIEIGGMYLLAVLRGRIPLTPFQRNFHRAGHAHAGVLVTLGLVVQPFADASGLEGVLATIAHSGAPAAAIFVPAGFFLSTIRPGATQPNGFVVLIYVGAALLAAGTFVLGVGLLA